MRLFYSFLLCLVFVLGFSQSSNDAFLNEKQLFDYYYDQLKKFRDLQIEDSMLLYGDKALSISEKINEPKLQAKAEIVLGNYYFNKNESDSAAYRHYHTAYDYYLILKDSTKISKTLLRLSIIEKNNNYFIKSKESLFKALGYLNDEKVDFLHEIYNNIGIVFTYLGNLTKSIEYYQKSLELRKKMNNPELVIQSYNNIAIGYMNNGNYNSARKYYQKGLSYPIDTLEKYPTEYARILDNSTHLDLLTGQHQESQLINFEKALSIREKNEDLLGIIISRLHLAEYYQKQGDIKNSNQYAQKAYTMAKESETYIDAIRSLDVLIENAQNQSNYKQAFEYAQQRQDIIDKKNKHEQAVGEKFADIRYEAQEKEKENDRLKIKTQQQEIQSQKNRIYIFSLIGISILLLLIALAGAFYSKIRAKQKELISQQKEQEAEKEISELLLKQQGFAEKAKQREQERISRDLHDGIAGKLSGVMLRIDNLSDKVTPEVKSKVEYLAQYISEIVEETHTIVHDLNQERIKEISFQTLMEQLLKNQLSNKIQRTYEVDKTFNWDNVSNRIKIAVYYILQQALRNIQEHAEATKVTLRIQPIAEEILFEIIDNGKGFSTEHTDFTIGIPSMKERAESAGGHFQIKSDLNQGTQITIKF